VRNFTYTNAVATGPVQPEGALSALVGESAAGPWALVVVDDSGGSTGMLKSWSLTISTLSSLPPAMPPADFTGDGGNIPDNNPDGFSSTVDVSGLGSRLLSVSATVSITHPNGAQLDVFLTSPAGTRIDLATDLGNGVADVYQDTTFSDAADAPISDVTAPMAGETFGTVIPEGALGAFMGENPNGTWMLTVVDDSGGTTGKLDGWTLHVTAVAACGDGVVGAGEACDDGNATDGDGCDHDCTVSACGNGIVGGAEQCDDGNTADGDGCSSSCMIAESTCDNCVDDDGNGLTDAADPGCSTGTLTLGRSSAIPAKGVLKLKGDVPLPDGAGGPMSLVLADGNGTVFCASLGDAVRKGKKVVATGSLAGGTVTVSIARGLAVVKGKKLDLSAFDDANVHVGIGIGAQRFAGAGAFRTRGPKRIYP
jgi:cysteine-rich repeat protein